MWVSKIYMCVYVFNLLKNDSCCKYSFSTSSSIILATV